MPTSTKANGETHETQAVAATMALKSTPDKWKPAGITSLEPAADEAVRSDASTVVIAGPGAGKTELLAQRACYLLETATCPAPHRILAISFKRDAAKNLRDRVAKRCGAELSRRFDSFTFDAFAKSLLDRFYRGLPASYKLKSEYEIRFDIDRSNVLRDRLSRLAEVDADLVNGIMQTGAETNFYKRHIIGGPLPRLPGNGSREGKLALAFWGDALRPLQSPPALNFPMIGRLAELLLRHNPRLIATLRYTYMFAFLDEFQDTTDIQYDLTTTAFKGSNSVLTAVGDPKQRIMVWAGALDGIFQRFEEDFGATPLQLVMNYRSAPRLVAIQRHLIAALDPDAPEPQPFHTDVNGEKGEGECNVFVYPDIDTEAQHVAELTVDTLKEQDLVPRDICILTRTWNDRYSALIIDKLAEHGVKARVEKTLQDLLAEPVTLLQLALLRLALSERDAEAWGEIMDVLAETQSGAADDSRVRSSELKLASFCSELRKRLSAGDFTRPTVEQILSETIEFFGEERLKTEYPQYGQGTLLSDLQKQLADEFVSRLERKQDWSTAVEDIEGKDSVPIMTVHKSKGLEYHTVIFVGLEDSALWGFAKAPEEEKCGFFVAFSRAITRVVFTFCRTRPRSVGGYPEKQTAKTIGVLYKLLQAAGVTVTEVGTGAS